MNEKLTLSKSPAYKGNSESTYTLFLPESSTLDENLFIFLCTSIFPAIPSETICSLNSLLLQANALCFDWNNKFNIISCHTLVSSLLLNNLYAVVPRGKPRSYKYKRKNYFIT